MVMLKHSIACFIIRPVMFVNRLRCVLPCHGTLRHGPRAGPCDEARQTVVKEISIRIGFKAQFWVIAAKLL